MYKIGTLVKYKVSNKETIVLEVKGSYNKDEDTLSSALGIAFTPTRMYWFANSIVMASENEIEPFTLKDLGKIVKRKGTLYLEK